MQEIQPIEQLNREERRAWRRHKKEAQRESTRRAARGRRAANWGIGGALAVLVIGGLIWYAASRPPLPESDIISRSGFHWHPELAIYVKNEKQDIPANIGLGAVHKPIHTHDDDNDQGIIHLEFQSIARKSDIALGQFFKNWGKDMRSFGANMKMAVNGEENSEYENYVMRDQDKIELRYE